MSRCSRSSLPAAVRSGCDRETNTDNPAAPFDMPLPLTRREKLILAIIAMLIVLGLIGMAVL